MAVTATGFTVRRRPWLAALLAFLNQPAGLVYVGRLRLAFAFLAIPLAAVLILSFTRLGALADGLGLLVAFALPLVLPLVAATVAWRTARRRPLIPRRWFVRWPGIVVVIVATLIMGLAAVIIVRGRVPAYRVPSGSMLPTLVPGDHFVAFALGSVERARLARGSIVTVTFEPRQEGGYTTIKRVVAVAGDRIAFENDVPIVNGRPLARSLVRTAALGEIMAGQSLPGRIWRERSANGLSYEVLDLHLPSAVATLPEQVVPGGAVFLVGDNRDDSLNSRSPSVGPVPIDRVRERPGRIYWSSDLSRIGLSLTPAGG